jgi:tetratricopeptide (TPR) repeat protein
MEERRISKSEIDSVIKGKDDFVKLDYLNRFLEKADNIEIKKYILLNLAEVSENRGLFSEAVKQISLAGEIAITYREKIEFFMKEAELWIKLKNFEMAEKAFKKSYFYGSSQEKIELKKHYEDLYKIVGDYFKYENKTQNAIDVYEKALRVCSEKDKELEILKALLKLYEKVGNFSEFNRIKEKLDLR